MISKNLNVATFLAVVCLGLLTASTAFGAQTDLIGPTWSVGFGAEVVMLANGNFVVTDPSASPPGFPPRVGAVHLYNVSGELISTLTGSTIGDSVGNRGVERLASGNFVVRSPSWNDNGVSRVGAVTWVNGTTGLSGVVSPMNSLVGSKLDDEVGSGWVYALSNGNYVVISNSWDSTTLANVGVITWADGATGLTGRVSPDNSRIGARANDSYGPRFVEVGLGNYVVFDSFWRSGTGFATWGSGTSPILGVISESNSLVGDSPADQVGESVVVLTNGNYVVSSPNSDNGNLANTGAVTWGAGDRGISGIVSTKNSMVGGLAHDYVGERVTPLSNGNFVIQSSRWNNKGAATWCNGAMGCAGLVTTANSLVGKDFDGVGSGGITALKNGNYVVSSDYWNGAVTGVGAITWANGSTGRVGIVTSENSIIGTHQTDRVGVVTALNTGGYVVGSPVWDSNTAIDVGAITVIADGSSEFVGTVNSGNSLIGSTNFDRIGGRVTALRGSRFIAESSIWNNGSALQAGAITWGDSEFPFVGVVSVSNSFVGMMTNDRVGSQSITVLTTGDFVVNSPFWNSGAGAVTWASGTVPLLGAVSPANSLVGKPGDQIGVITSTALKNGRYVILSPYWDSPLLSNIGAVTIAPSTGLVGSPTNASTVFGTSVNGGLAMVSSVSGSGKSYDYARDRLLVGRPNSNVVTILSGEAIVRDGFESED